MFRYLALKEQWLQGGSEPQLQGEVPGDGGKILRAVHLGVHPRPSSWSFQHPLLSTQLSELPELPREAFLPALLTLCAKLSTICPLFLGRSHLASFPHISHRSLLQGQLCSWHPSGHPPKAFLHIDRRASAFPSVGPCRVGLDSQAHSRCSLDVCWMN